jgi:hypothetical protein
VSLLVAEREHKLTVVCAPAGSCRSTLLGEWQAAPEETRPFAWLLLDPADHDPVRFWSYAIGALRSIRPDLGTASLDALGRPGARSRYAFTWTQRVPRLEAVEAHEDLDDAPISERDVVADGVELSIEGHRCPARPAARIVGLGRAVGLAADAMARPNLGRRPLETGRGLGLRGQWVGFQTERRDALRHAAQATPRRCRNEAKEQCSATRPGSSHERVRPLHRACCRTRHDRDELSAAV